MKFLAFLKTHYITVIGVIIVLAILIYGGLQACETAEFNRQVNTQTNQANAAVKQAVNAQNAAVNAEIERRTEDTIREKTINPRLNESRRQSQNSKAALDAAKRQYKNAQNPTNLSSSISDNCAELVRLYPNVRFDYCQP